MSIYAHLDARLESSSLWENGGRLSFVGYMIKKNQKNALFINISEFTEISLGKSERQTKISLGESVMYCLSPLEKPRNDVKTPLENPKDQPKFPLGKAILIPFAEKALEYPKRLRLFVFWRLWRRGDSILPQHQEIKQ